MAPAPSRWVASRTALLLCLALILIGISGAWTIFMDGRIQILVHSQKANDNASWLVGQLDTELHRLRAQFMKVMLGDSSRSELDIRVDVFASRIALLDSPVVRSLLGSDVEVNHLAGELKDFVAEIDLLLVKRPALPSRDEMNGLVLRSEALAEPVRRLAVQTVQLAAMDDTKDAHEIHQSADRTGIAFLSVIAIMAAAIVWLIWQHRELNDAFSRLLNITKQLEAASEAKANFLASMSHELRTPLNAVIGFSDAMRMQIHGTLNERYLGYIDHIHSAGAHLLKLINDILDLSKVSSGKFSIERVTFNLRDEIIAAISMLSPRAERSGITVRFDKCCDEPVIEGDPLRVRQIVINLLSNAVKFTPSGGLVEVTCERGEASLCLTIADSGCGMEAGQIAEALLPFSQLCRRNGTAVEGTGLGLPLTKGLVEAHGGTMEINSVLGVGTRALVRFPRPAALPSAIVSDVSDACASCPEQAQ